MKIRRWALLTASLYALSLIVLSLPLFLVAFTDGPPRDAYPKGLAADDVFSDLLFIYQLPHYWICVGVLTVFEGVLLLIPIQVSMQRPVRKRSWVALAITAGFMMALLLYALGLGVLEVIYFDKFPDWSAAWALGIGFAGWLIWGAVFFCYSIRDESTAFSMTIDTLIAGSIVELLVAVPCHVYVRQQNYCCAGFPTFLGIATGLSVLLFAFGPGVLLLFVKRARRLRAKSDAVEAEVVPPLVTGYSRRATIWALGALCLAVIPVILSFFPVTYRKETWVVFRAGFVHAAAIACIYAWIALRRKEARGTWVLAGVAILAEMALLQAWLLARYPI